MKPYYDDGQITIYHADCRDVLPMMPKASVDLLVTDPPYGVAWQSNQRKQAFDRIAGDNDQETALSGLSMALNCLKDKRHIYLFGRYDLSGLPLTAPCELIWDKQIFNAGDLTSTWGNQHEYITFTTLRRARTERESGGRLTARMRRGSVLRYLRPSGSAVNRHPTEKPVDLLRELIESSSCLGETVLDPFMGSGSTIEAAQREGRRAIGIEIEEKYCEIAVKRLQQAVLPLAMTGD